MRIVRSEGRARGRRSNRQTDIQTKRRFSEGGQSGYFGNIGKFSAQAVGGKEEARDCPSFTRVFEG